MCNKTDIECPRPGTKRKPETDEFDEIYVPPKRISPFLNTPKERKDERKRVLKISIQKLRQLEDPEIFLRRSVLINNTMKKLQNEVKEEKARNPKRSSKRKDFSGYGVLNNSCLSNSYLFDDPFLSGVHEKITDDMTDTLVNNLHDKLCDIPHDKGTEQADVLCTCLSANKANIQGAVSQTNESALNNQNTMDTMDFDFSPSVTESPKPLCDSSKTDDSPSRIFERRSDSELLCSQVPEPLNNSMRLEDSNVHTSLNCVEQTTCGKLTDGGSFDVKSAFSSNSVTSCPSAQQASTNCPSTNTSCTVTVPAVDSDYCASIYTASVHYSLSMDQTQCSHSTCSFESYATKPIGIVSAHSVLFTES